MSDVVLFILGLAALVVGGNQFIKGAARIVGIEAAVALSHIIEDCFVAARDGRIEMTSS